MVWLVRQGWRGGGEGRGKMGRFPHWYCHRTGNVNKQHHEDACHTKAADLRLGYQSLCSIQRGYLLSLCEDDPSTACRS